MGEYKRFALLVFVIIGPLLVVGATAGDAEQAEPKEAVAAVAHDFYPEYMVDADGHPGGFAIDLMNAVAERAGLSVTYRVFETWSDLIAALGRGDADLVPVVAVTRARQGRMLFTRPVVTSPASLFVRRDADDIRGWADLAGRRVAVIEGGFSAEILGERIPSARLVRYAGLKHALFDLLSGEVDALVSFQSSVWKVGERVRVADRIKVLGEPLTEAKRAIAVRQDMPRLRDRLDAAVAEFLDSSEYRQLYAKWYSGAPPFWTSGRVGWLAGASTALLLLSMLIWQSLSLRAESRRLAESAPGRKLPEERPAIEFPARVISQACGLIALALGFAVLLGWTFDVPALKRVLPGLFAMQPWAAVTIVLAGGTLLVATVPGRIAAATCTALGATVLIIGLQMLLQHATGIDFGTDRWFFPEAVGNQPGHSHPGRVAEVTSIAFVLLGAVLLLARVERAWARVVFSTIGTVGLLLMAAPLLGYLIGAGVLQSAAFFTPIALHAALGLVVLFLGALALRPDTGWMALLSGDMPGATSARMLLPVAVAGPVLLAWLFTSGKQAGLYGPDFQVGLITLATIALLANAFLWNAARLDRLDRARLAAAWALRQSEARYRTLVEGQPDPICQFLPDTTLTFVNRAYADFYGQEPEDLVGRRWLDFAPRDERPRFLEELTSFTPEHPERHEETHSTRVDHEVRWYMCHLYGFFDDAGKIVSFQTFGTDITVRKRAEERLAQQLGLLKEDITERKEIEEQLRQSQKMQAVGQLTGGIAHDFNNLLAIVIGNLQLLGERVSGDAKTREYLDDALWSARRGGELTHRLLAFARKQPLKPTVIDLNEVVRSMTELLRRTLGASIRIKESLAPDMRKAFADRGELERALVNLAVNARDAMRGGGTLTLETRNAVLDENYAEHYQEVTPGEYALLAVTDTGTGMPPEIMQRVFEPFFTTKEVGQGSGLGLSMVYGFVKQSGGHVSIYSRLGQGTSVKLYLQRAASLPARPEEDSPDVPPEEFGGKVVLVVEDEPKLRKVAVQMLDRLGLQSLQAETAKDALELLADRHVDVLFTDIELPGGMNGTELAETAQKLAPNIKVLFTTGYARETTLREGGLHERTPWLLKPYSHRELARELKTLLVPTVR